MEAFRESLLSGNIVVWIVAIIVFVIFLKLLKSAGKIALVLILMVAVGFVLQSYAPGVIDPLVEFVKGGWLGSYRP